jgi:uridine phosphorylase
VVDPEAAIAAAAAAVVVVVVVVAGDPGRSDAIATFLRQPIRLHGVSADYRG